ncbi:lipid IV(A) 3-deoxy-D-manno-octulosonic acid transferase [Tianweitania sediminis]|uniref:3-deoxy-D-manno-octulosonic acid transferase n=1 Tax=Tianweitania sediminis TaxID=1502156 RepID=A0A8J7R070_9HYPH|nr:lipid IV(A) 3-deoxy-D-manno-octulosonic acid transferase [Tianweitania sediminis]
MSERRARQILSLYSWAGAAAYPLVGPYIALRASRGKEDRQRRGERYGRASEPRPEGPLVWIHAASVGETGAVLPLIGRLLRLGIRIVLTTGTVTSARIVAERLGDRVIHQYVPLDLRPAVNRFLDHWKPDLAIFAESEIWPTTILSLGRRRVPQVLVNGRLSDRSFEAWKKRPHLAEALFENFAHVAAQSGLDGERFLALGARPVTVSGNLKLETDLPPYDAAIHARLMKEIGGRPVWAAVSTHDGEEMIAAEVHRLLKNRHDDVLTVIVPRHAERGDALASDLSKRGLKVARQSLGDTVQPDVDVLLGDTMGDMGLYLRLSGIAFVGRSLTGSGGQNPIEPALLDTAVLAGENVQNFRDTYKRLVDRGGARLVKNKETLAGAVSFLLKNEDARQKMARAARVTVHEMRGALDKTMDVLDPFIHPLVVKSRLDSSGSN